MSSITPVHLDFDISAGHLVGDYWAAPEPAGTPLVLLHGGGQTRHSWDRSAQALAADGRRVYTLDLRGHGDSSWAPDGDYGLDRFVDDLLAAIATIDEAPILVGASLGGITSLCAAGEHPASTAALVMVDVVVHVVIASRRS